MTQRKETRKPKVTLVISGAISLGSFESGVIYELARAARAKNGPFTVDFVAGTSAGSITGAQVAKVLVAPHPDFSSFAMWQDVTLHPLTTGYEPQETSPLSHRWIKQQLEEQLTSSGPESEVQPNDTGDAYEPGPAQDEIYLLVTLTDLEGEAGAFFYGEGIDVDTEGCFNGVTVTTRLTSGPETDWGRVAKLVLGSSAHSAAWEAVQIEVPASNSGAERWEPEAMYESLLVRQHARKEAPSFVDGGTVTNLPVGSALRMMRRRGKGWSNAAQPAFDPQRIVLYVDPDPVVPKAKPDEFRRWARTLGRAASIYSGSPVPQGDLRWVGESNEEVVHLLKTVTILGKVLEERVKPGDGGDKVIPLRLHADLLPAAFGQAAAAAEFLPTDRTPEPDAPSSSDECVKELYQWFDSVLAGCKNQGEAVTALLAAMEGPLGGDAASWNRASRNVRMAILDLGRLYYSFKEKGEPLTTMLKQVHMDAARQTPAGNRQWVYVTRIVPGDEKPYSRTLGHFGGFLNPEWMKYDYQLGRSCAIRWLTANFPESPYVKQQIREKPVMPAVSVQQPDPVLWAKNAGPVAAVISQLEKTALEELPWLKSRTVRLLSQTAGWLLLSTVTRLLGLGLTYLPFGAKLTAWLSDFLDNYLQGQVLSVSAQGLPYAIGLAVVYWWSRTGWDGRVRVLMTLWAVAHHFKRLWEALKALWRRKEPVQTPSQTQ